MSQGGREVFEMNVFDDLGDDTLETGVAAAKIVYGDNIWRKTSMGLLLG
jgi:hypothetical protein